MKIFLVIAFLSFPILDEISFDKYNSNLIDGLMLQLDPFDVSTYIYNKYYPNFTIDYCESGYCIEGELGLPIKQTISQKLFFDIDSLGTYTQLSYKQKKSDLYFDTNIGLKTDINNSTNFIFKGETKSILDNINQNYIFEINKINQNSNFKVGYLYHIENLPSIDLYKSIARDVESFHLGCRYELSYNKINLNFSSALQLSNNERLFSLNNQGVFEGTYIYKFRSEWNSLDVSYNLRNNITFKAFYNYKDNLIDENNSINKSMKKHIGLDLSYIFRSYSVNIGLEKLNEEVFPRFALNYNNSAVEVSIIKDSFIAREPLALDEGLDVSYENISNLRLELLYDNYNITNLFSIGEITLSSDSYLYFSAKNSYRLKYLVFDLNYNYYNSDITFFNEMYMYSLTVLPPLKTEKYILYGKIFENVYRINSDFDINLNDINLFTYNESIETVYDVSIFSLEFGFIFDSFKISYIKRSPFKEYVEFNNEDLKYLRYDYIDLVWYFND